MESITRSSRHAQKAARQRGHAEMPVRFVDSIRPQAQVRHICVGTRTAVEPRQHLDDRIADDDRIVVLYRETRLSGEMA
jgi:hypothetical protein